jgi:hypothetical protein
MTCMTFNNTLFRDLCLCHTGLFVTIHYNTLHYNTIHYTTLQYNTLQYTRLQYTRLQYTRLQYTRLQYTRQITEQDNKITCMTLKNTLFRDLCLCHTGLFVTIQYNTIQYNTIQYNTIQYNTIQYNTIDNSLNKTIK